MKLSEHLNKIAKQLKISYDMNQTIQNIDRVVYEIYRPQLEALNWDEMQKIFDKYLEEDAPSKEDWKTFKDFWLATSHAYRALEHLRKNVELLFDEDLREEFLRESKLRFYFSMLKHGIDYKNVIVQALQKLNEIIPDIFKKPEFKGLMFKITQLDNMQKEFEEFYRRELKQRG